MGSQKHDSNHKLYIVPNCKSLQTTILNLMQMGESCPKGRKLCGKRRNCSLRAISPFPTVFFKRLVQQTRKTQGIFGKGLNHLFMEYGSFLAIISPYLHLQNKQLQPIIGIGSCIYMLSSFLYELDLYCFRFVSIFFMSVFFCIDSVNSLFSSPNDLYLLYTDL